MKNLATNPSFIMFSRMKEVFEGVLSIFDGDKYTTSDYDEFSLPNVLQQHTKKLAEIATQYEINGTLLNTIEQQSATTIKEKNPKTTPSTNKQINPIEKLVNTNIIVDKELGEDR